MFSKKLAPCPLLTFIHVGEKDVGDVILQIRIEFGETQRETERSKIVTTDADQLEDISCEIVTCHRMIHQEISD